MCEALSETASPKVLLGPIHLIAVHFSLGLTIIYGGCDWDYCFLLIFEKKKFIGLTHSGVISWTTN